MTKFNLFRLKGSKGEHFLQEILDWRKLRGGSLSFYQPGQVSHPEGRHVHEDREVFVNLQGKATLLLEGQEHPFEMGDIVVIEPGEDHHLVADEEKPVVNLWLHGE